MAAMNEGRGLRTSRLAAARGLRRRAMGWLRQAERGEDTTYEFTVWIVPIVIMILLIAFATLVRAAQMPAWSAASECARAAIATLDESLGRTQGTRAAFDSLRGNFIKATAATVTIAGNWTPNSSVTCRVSYDIDLSELAGFNDLTGGAIPMSAEVTLRVEPYKSRWR
jgi:hypothetical protein